jgi:hypothetical protein
VPSSDGLNTLAQLGLLPGLADLLMVAWALGFGPLLPEALIRRVLEPLLLANGVLHIWLAAG